MATYLLQFLDRDALAISRPASWQRPVRIDQRATRADGCARAWRFPAAHAPARLDPHPLSSPCKADWGRGGAGSSKPLRPSPAGAARSGDMVSFRTSASGITTVRSASRCVRVSAESLCMMVAQSRLSKRWIAVCTRRRTRSDVGGSMWLLLTVRIHRGDEGLLLPLLRKYLLAEPCDHRLLIGEAWPRERRETCGWLRDVP